MTIWKIKYKLKWVKLISVKIKSIDLTNETIVGIDSSPVSISWWNIDE